MRFKVKQNQQQKHSEICTAVAWLGNDAYSVGDDNVIYKWDSDTLQSTKFIELETYPTDIDWMPSSKGQQDIMAIGFTDGSFQLISKNGRVEKKVTDAHKNGALISLKWSHDGGSLVTSGEDGTIKIWSRTGNLRSNLVQIDKPIYKVIFSPDNDSIAYSTDKFISIKPIQVGQKELQWKAHDGVVLQIDWNACNNMIVSCGEDCKYKVWDSFGRLLYSSIPYDYVITSVAWSPNGEYFSVGAYGMLKLCDKTGWTYSFEKIQCGSLMQVAWSADSTICAGAAGNGQCIFGYCVDRFYSYENWEINLNEDNKMQITDLKSEIVEDIDFKERIINMTIAYNYMILNTSRQCYIYNLQNINTPHIFEVKDAISLILQTAKYFALVDVSHGILIYNYEGRQLSNPKIPGIKYENLNQKKISISQDILAIVDGTQPKLIKFYDIMSGQQMNFTLEHSLEITEIHLNQVESANDRKIAFIDNNKDLYLSPVHKRDVTKLSSMCDSFLWNDSSDILSCISDGRLITWYYPSAIYVDKDLMDLCKYIKESQDIGRMSQMMNFFGSQVTLRRKDGGLINLAISPYPQMLFDFCEKQKWDKCIKLCRFVKETYLWACLAAASLYSRELNAAEIALAAIESVDKVQYINYVKELPCEAARQAALSLYFHKTTEAEQTLVQAKLYYRAIKLNVKLYKWDRAYDLCQQFKVHQDTFVAYRARYLKKIDKQETNKKFEALAKEIGEPNWEDIKQRIKQEKEREQNMR